MAGYRIKLETSNQHEFNPIIAALSTQLLFLAPFLDRLRCSSSPEISLHYIPCRSNTDIPLVSKSSHLISNATNPVLPAPRISSRQVDAPNIAITTEDPMLVHCQSQRRSMPVKKRWGGCYEGNAETLVVSTEATFYIPAQGCNTRHMLGGETCPATPCIWEKKVVNCPLVRLPCSVLRSSLGSESISQSRTHWLGYNREYRLVRYDSGQCVLRIWGYKHPAKARSYVTPKPRNSPHEYRSPYMGPALPYRSQQAFVKQPKKWVTRLDDHTSTPNPLRWVYCTVVLL